MDENELKSKYKQKAVESFDTKFEIFLFDLLSNHMKFNKETAKLFSSFEIKEKHIEKYTSAWQIKYNSDEYLGWVKQIDEEIKRIHEEEKDLISSLKKEYIKEENFSKLFKYEDFANLYNNEKCFYCGITEKMINQLIEKKKLYKKHISRGWTFEIDRRKPNLEYTKDNSVLCCYWCNNAKTDEFSDIEFAAIGEEIRKIWLKRLNDDKR